MYEAIKQKLIDEFDTLHNANNLSYEEAYETLYHLTSRLSDMDDFSTGLLKDIYKAMGEDLSDESFVKAFQYVIDSEYESADFDYFKDSVISYKADLNEALQKAVKSSSPSRSWNADIYWLFNHAVINVDGTDYTVKQLQSLLDKEDNEDESRL